MASLKFLHPSMPKKRVVFVLVESPFTDWDYKRFNLAGLESCADLIAVIDLTQLLKPSYLIGKQGCPTFERRWKEDKFTLLRPSSISQLLAFIFKYRPICVLDYALSCQQECYLRRLVILLALKIFSKRIIFRLSAIPSNTRYLGKRMRFRAHLLSFKDFFLRLPWRIFPADFGLISCLQAEGLILPCIQKIFVHTTDYDRFQTFKPFAFTTDSYILFLDQDEPFHDDYAHWGTCPPVTPEVYFKDINTALHYISHKAGLSIKIQPHPRADLPTTASYYQYELSSFDTLTSIKGSSFVVAHSSTAIGLAVLMNKPIVLIKASEHSQGGNELAWIMSFATELGVEILEFDKRWQYPKIDSEKYKKFIGNYLKHPKSRSRSIQASINEIIQSM